MLKRIIGIILVIIGIILFIYFSSASGRLLPHTTFWKIFSVVLFMIGVAVIYYIYSSKQSNIRKLFNEFKAESRKINIAFENCEIKSNQYFEEVNKSSSNDIQTWNSLLHPNNAVSSNEVNLSRIIYREGNTTFVSPIIAKDEVTLQFLLDKQQSTIIYVDKDDVNNYYFDVEFLFK